MNKGLMALKNSGPKGREAYEKITGKEAMYGMKNPMAMAEYGKKIMMAMGGINSLSEKEKQQYAAMGMKAIKDYGMGGKMYAEGGITERNAGLFRGSDEQNVYDDFGNIVGTRKETSKLRSLLGADEVLYDNEGNKVAKVNEKKNKTKVTFYDKGGLTDDGEDKKELTTNESALLDVLRRAMATPGVEVTGSSASPALLQGLGYTSAVDATAAPIKGFIAPSGEERPDEPVVTVAPKGVSPIAPRQPGPILIKTERGIVPLGMQGREVMPDQYAPEMVFDPKMRGEQRPRAMYQYDYDAGSYKERPIEIEELAQYLYSQQIPGAGGTKMIDGKYVKVDPYPTIEDAARAAQRLLSGDPSMGRGRANMPPGYGYGGKLALFGRRNRRKAMEEEEDRLSSTGFMGSSMETFGRPKKSRGQGGRMYKFGGKY